MEFILQYYIFFKFTNIQYLQPIPPFPLQGRSLHKHLYFIQTYCIIITYGKITEHEEFKYMKKNKNLQNPVNPCCDNITDEGGANPRG